MEPTPRNERWSMDFVHVLLDGRRLRTFGCVKKYLCPKNRVRYSECTQRLSREVLS